MTRRGWLWVGVALLATVGWAQAQGAAPAVERPSMEAIGQALAERGLVLTDLQYGRTETQAWAKSASQELIWCAGLLDGHRVSVAVDVDDLDLSGFVAFGYRWPDLEPSPVETAQAAYSLACEYLARLGVPLAGIDPLSVGPPRRGGIWDVSFQGRRSDGVLTNGLTSVRLAADDGRLISYRGRPRLDPAYAVPEALVDAEAAVAAARAGFAAGDVNGNRPAGEVEILAVKRLVTVGPTTRQSGASDDGIITVWEVRGRGAPEQDLLRRPATRILECIAWVDDQTGETLLVVCMQRTGMLVGEEWYD